MRKGSACTCARQTKQNGQNEKWTTVPVYWIQTFFSTGTESPVGIKSRMIHGEFDYESKNFSNQSKSKDVESGIVSPELEMYFIFHNCKTLVQIRDLTTRKGNLQYPRGN